MQTRTFKTLAIFLVLLIALTVSGCAGQDADKAKAITTAIADNQKLEATLELSGVLTPARTVDISSKISGQVIKLDFRPGSAVKAGDILMQLDTETLKAQLEQAKAGLQSAEAAAQLASNQIAAAKINLDAAQKSYDRTKALFEAGATPQSQLDDVKDKLNIAQNQFQNASGPALSQAQAAVNTARANIKNLQVQIDSATIRSPLNGTIATQSVEAGEVVSPGVSVITIVDTSILKMKSTVTQDELPVLTNGKEMDITIDSYPDSKLKGVVSSIGPIAVNTGQIFPVEISIKNNGSLSAGLSARASMITEVQGIVVPSSSIIKNNGECFVFVIKDNIASKRAVKLGLNDDKGTQILKGLAAGEKVAVTNVNALDDNMSVNPD